MTVKSDWGFPINRIIEQREEATQSSLVDQMVGLEHETDAAKAELDPIKQKREEAKREIQVHRERLEAIEVRSAKSPRDCTPDFSMRRNESRRQTGSENRRKRTKRTGQRSTNRFKTRSTKTTKRSQCSELNLKYVFFVKDVMDLFLIIYAGRHGNKRHSTIPKVRRGLQKRAPMPCKRNSKRRKLLWPRAMLGERSRCRICLSVIDE